MTIIELMKILEATGYPVAYSHFAKSVNPPFICFLVDGSPNMAADNKIYQKINDINIELYTTKKDLKAEEALENILDKHEIPYSSGSDVFIQSEKVFQKIYEARLM
ncbi:MULTISPECIES: hypothetical protein [Bacillus]|uniref:hypothetical protein n=1 Tax=Bacillus TaxID=1386 RepID=UPI000BE65ED2|nr:MULTISPECIES: hypothetical protein [Bacillus]PDM38672.1 hypothetical protein CMV37_00410 [Bacillus cereus]MDA1690235.1 hypothetical protein [Bacillus cereus group sp. TH147LC]MDK7546454.1 hypothetical protein [Bacillus pacificus]MDK7550528.1 hypothetical protein [Bacillus pacificus]MDK7566074.1 hypothetical protein [Bacillus pacificus]